MTKTYGKLHSQGGNWIIDAEPHVLMKLRRIFARVKSKSGPISLRNTAEVCRDLQWVLERYPMGIGPKDLETINCKAREFDAKTEYFEKVLNSGTQRSFELALPAREYQKTAADLLLTMGSLLLGDELGLGKTCSAICTLTEPTTLPALIVCMTHLPEQWKREINRFAPNLRVHIAKKGTPDIPKGSEFDVYLVSYSKLAGWADHLAGQVESVIFDEVQELRRTGTAKYTAAALVSESCRYRMGLSATPIYNMGIEFYNVINVLRPDALGTQAEFLNEWCAGSYGSVDKAPIKDPKAFGAYIREQGILLRRTRKEVGRELPPCTQVEHFVECDESALEAVRSSVTELAKFILSKQGSRFDRMKAGGDLDWRMRQSTGIAKAPYVAEFIKMLASSGEKIVVFAWHHAVFNLLMERLKEFNPVKYTGEETPKQKEEAKKAFCEGDSQIFLMSLRAGAGLDGLQHVSSTAVVAELDWSSGVLAQCIGRLFRDGQLSPVIAYFLLANEGSDPIIADVLGIKRTQLEFVIDVDAEIVEKSPGKEIYRLAESVLKQNGVILPDSEKLVDFEN